MNKLIGYVARFAAASMIAVAHAAPPQVNPEAPDLDPEIAAKIHLEKGRRQQPIGEIGGVSSKDCGTVNINSNDKKSNSGIRDMFGKPTTTVITGPVINLAKCK